MPKQKMSKPLCSVVMNWSGGSQVKKCTSTEVKLNLRVLFKALEFNSEH